VFLRGYGFGVIIAALIAVWVAQDANKRGMNGIAWAIGVFLLCIIFLPIYLIVRKPLLAQQPYRYPSPGSQPPLPANYTPPPQPGAGAAQVPHHFCANCGAPLDPAAKFCANCGKPS
jgi:MFS family permease